MSRDHRLPACACFSKGWAGAFVYAGVRHGSGFGTVKSVGGCQKNRHRSGWSLLRHARLRSSCCENLRKGFEKTVMHNK